MWFHCHVSLARHRSRETLANAHCFGWPRRLGAGAHPLRSKILLSTRVCRRRPGHSWAWPAITLGRHDQSVPPVALVADNSTHPPAGWMTGILGAVARRFFEPLPAGKTGSGLAFGKTGRRGQVLPFAFTREISAHVPPTANRIPRCDQTRQSDKPTLIRPPAALC